MPVQLKKSDFKVLFDTLDLSKASTQARSRALRTSMAIPAVFAYARSNPTGSIIQKRIPDGPVRWLVGCANDFKNTVPPRATHRGFDASGNVVGWFKPSLVPKGWVEISNIISGPTLSGPLVISEFYQGKRCQATDGANRFDCTITITESVWLKVLARGSAMGLEQIKGILQQQPILVTTKSKQTGVRCIKPEPYGWVFSTSFSLRLTDTTHRSYQELTSRPTELYFDSIKRGH